jgi:prophage regulatory protein
VANISQFLRLPDVAARYGLSRASIYAMGARGEFPRPVKLGPRASAWVLEELEAWERKRIAASREAQSGRANAAP